MPDSAEKLGKHHANTSSVRVQSEYVRLVISDEPTTAEADTLQPQALTKRSHLWWIKAMIWCFSTVIILYVLLKWGVPFLFEKVFYLALHLLLWASVSLNSPLQPFPPSTPSCLQNVEKNKKKEKKN